MKTKIITTLKKELLIVEAKDEKIAWAIIFQKYGVKAVSDYTLLGKPDEIKEEDTFDFNYYVDYNHPSRGAYTVTALESFFPAIEKEITWVNPILNPSDIEDYHPTIDESIVAQNKFDKAQEKTFDKKRTLIFVKN